MWMIANRTDFLRVQGWYGDTMRNEPQLGALSYIKKYKCNARN